MTRRTPLHGDQVLTGAVVGATLGSDAPLGIGVSHGWRRAGEPMLVTGSRENRVLTLDDEPALDVYLRRQSVLSATDAACAEALVPLQGAAPVGVMAFVRIARRGVLEPGGLGREIDRVSTSSGGAPAAGFATYGEIARTSGTQSLHDQTLVVLAVG